MSTYGELLKSTCTMRALYSDPLTLNFHLTFCALEVSLYEAAINKCEQEGLSPLISAESKKQILVSALKIASTLRTTWVTQKPLVCHET